MFCETCYSPEAYSPLVYTIAEVLARIERSLGENVIVRVQRNMEQLLKLLDEAHSAIRQVKDEEMAALEAATESCAEKKRKWDDSIKDKREITHPQSNNGGRPENTPYPR